ncbi:uncharacterized protein KY384_005844 [Bacidia gigantensis]|uniref:uncharacterized protein n=1 Tax=Bacidia gigantensis TaxID=2732470 RepID=UPI001D053E8E|nr:uncharacterized protein KY384_005844 [Bacidia gigantensis]KAG8529209.1 hypothetical protein KY384_005844 [Bacidia gigantensis]
MPSPPPFPSPPSPPSNRSTSSPPHTPPDRERDRVPDPPPTPRPAPRRMVPQPRPFSHAPPVIPPLPPPPQEGYSGILIPSTPPPPASPPSHVPFSPHDPSTQPEAQKPPRRALWITYTKCGHRMRVLLPAGSKLAEPSPPDPTDADTSTTNGNRNGNNPLPPAPPARGRARSNAIAGSRPALSELQASAPPESALPDSGDGAKAKKTSENEDVRYMNSECQDCLRIAAVKAELVICERYSGRITSLSIWIEGMVPGSVKGDSEDRWRSASAIIDVRAIKCAELDEAKVNRTSEIKKAWREYEDLFGLRPQTPNSEGEEPDGMSVVDDGISNPEGASGASADEEGEWSGRSAEGSSVGGDVDSEGPKSPNCSAGSGDIDKDGEVDSSRGAERYKELDIDDRSSTKDGKNSAAAVGRMSRKAYEGACKTGALLGRVREMTESIEEELDDYRAVQNEDGVLSDEKAQVNAVQRQIDGVKILINRRLDRGRGKEPSDGPGSLINMIAEMNKGISDLYERKRKREQRGEDASEDDGEEGEQPSHSHLPLKTPGHLMQKKTLPSEKQKSQRTRDADIVNAAAKRSEKYAITAYRQGHQG